MNNKMIACLMCQRWHTQVWSLIPSTREGPIYASRDGEKKTGVDCSPSCGDGSTRKGGTRSPKGKKDGVILTRG